MLKRLLTHRLVQNTLVLYGVQIAGYVLPLLTLPYLTRTLGPANFGRLSLGLALVQYFWVISEYGFSITATRRVAVASETPAEVSRIYSAVMACKLCLLAVCFAAMTAIVGLTPQLRSDWPLYFASYLTVVGWGLSPNWLFQGVQRIRLIAYSDYGAKIVSVVMIFHFVRKPGDYALAAAIQSGGFVVSALIGLTLCFLVVRVRPVLPTLAEMKSHMTEGWPVFISNAGMTLTASTNMMILGWRATPDQVGFYSGAQRLIVSMRALVNPITNAVYPHISKVAARSRQEADTFLRRRLVWLSAPFLLASIVLLFAAPLVSRLVYGPRFAEAGVVLRIMAFTPFAHSMGMCFSTYYMLAFGYQKQWSRIIQAMLALNFVLVAVLLPIMPATRAVSLAVALVDGANAAACMWFYWRTEHRPRKQQALAADHA